MATAVSQHGRQSVLRERGAGGGAGEIPQTVRDAVLARASRLGARARTFLDAAAIFPLHAELWLFEALAGEAVDALDECVGSGMLSRRPEASRFDMSSRGSRSRSRWRRSSVYVCIERRWRCW